MKRTTFVACGLATLVLVPLLGAGLACVASRPQEVGLVDGRLRPCPPTPNCVCSERASASAAIDPLAFEGDADSAWASLLDFVAHDERTTIVTRDGEYAHVLYRTRWLHFTDDVELRLDRARSVIHVRSGARIGRSDFGTNRRRVESIRARWRSPSVASER